MTGSNPMLAETFEDPRMRFIAEKVCHNPVILAFHAEGDGWELYATSGGKTKFWGRCFRGLLHPMLTRILVCRQEFGDNTTGSNTPGDWERPV